ncbi:MAG TPA: EamA family transporter [Candidatus Cybelea sp.]|nr:EamA family transporter [Candidatus Cybelea sp.]
MSSLTLLAVFVAVLSIGQILFKQTAVQVAGAETPAGMVVGMFASPVFYCAMVLYGAATLLWIYILTRVPLNRAYPFVAAAMIVVPLLSWFVFGERTTPRYWIGAALICAGIVLTQTNASR